MCITTNTVNRREHYASEPLSRLPTPQPIKELTCTCHALSHDFHGVVLFVDNKAGTYWVLTYSIDFLVAFHLLPPRFWQRWLTSQIYSGPNLRVCLAVQRPRPRRWKPATTSLTDTTLNQTFIPNTAARWRTRRIMTPKCRNPNPHKNKLITAATVLALGLSLEAAVSLSPGRIKMVSLRRSSWPTWAIIRPET